MIDTGRYRVLLLDASSMRQKVCAGLLSPDAQKLLNRYKIAPRRTFSFIRSYPPCVSLTSAIPTSAIIAALI
jgi:hypothetical protein